MRPIDADALYRKVKAACNPYGKPIIGFEDGKKVLEMIKQAPSVDVKCVDYENRDDQEEVE